MPKYLAKASNGWHHSKGFTLEDFHEPIMIKPVNARILQESCLKCHGAAQRKGGLSLRSLAAMLEGGDNGPALVKGNLDESLIVEART